MIAMAHDYTQIDQQYPAIIALMPVRFTSHEFIRRFAQQNQMHYIDALAAYRSGPAPFRTLHAQLSERLYLFDHLVRHIGSVPSDDIFGDPSECAQWEKL